MTSHKKTAKKNHAEIKTSINPTEVAKFHELAATWWNSEGPLKTLHDINPCRLEYIRDFTPLEGRAVLDLGCGGGILSEAMAKAGAVVTGLDADPALIHTAQSHAKEQSLSINYICSPVESFESTPFDVITCMEMLEHVDDPALILEHCARLLKPQGYLFLSTINRTLKAYLTAVIGAEYVFKLLPRQTHDYDRFIKPSELARFIRACGLELINIKGMDYNPFSRDASLSESTEVNYMLVCIKT